MLGLGTRALHLSRERGFSISRKLESISNVSPCDCNSQEWPVSLAMRR
jgi:hypothetical protein